MLPGRERSIDVSTLGPPEPLVLTLQAAEALQVGEYLRMRHRMKPCHLYAELAQRAFGTLTRRADDGMCLVYIWRVADAGAAAAAEAAAAPLAAWEG